MNNDDMIIVYSSSDMYSGVCAASLASLFETNREYEMTVYLIEEGISEEHQRWIRQIAEKYNRDLRIIPMISLEQMAAVQIRIPEGCSLSTFGRLFLPTMLPDDIDKALYIDCDTIIMKPVNELWQIDVSDNMAAMVNDGHSMAYRRILGLKTQNRYFSSGVMLINLKEWRERGIEKEFIRYIHDQKGYVPIGDQGVINAVCDGEILQLPLRYNVYTAIIAFDHQEFIRLRSLSEFYSEEEYRQAKNNPVIMHYMTNFYLPIRPWQKGSDHPYAEEFIRYRELTPWKDEPLWDDKRSAIKKLYTTFCHSVPRSWTVEISSLIHEHFIPLSHKYKKARHILQQRRQKA